MKYYEKDKVSTLPVREAVGRILLHDITRIVPDLFKGPLFKKGHIITPEDVGALLDIGKEHIYVAGLKNEIHENQAAMRIARAALGKNIEISQPREGKVGFTARRHGLLKINVRGLAALNSVQDVIFASLHTNRAVNKGQDIAGTRVVPLTIPEKQVADAEKVCEEYFPIIEVKPFAALDELTRTALAEELSQRWQPLQPTVLWITHNIQEAVLLADRIILLSDSPGTILADVPVNLLRPRNADDPAFHTLVSQLRNRLLSEQS